MGNEKDKSGMESGEICHGTIVCNSRVNRALAHWGSAINPGCANRMLKQGNQSTIKARHPKLPNTINSGIVKIENHCNPRYCINSAYKRSPIKKSNPKKPKTLARKTM